MKNTTLENKIEDNNKKIQDLRNKLKDATKERDRLQKEYEAELEKERASQNEVIVSKIEEALGKKVTPADLNSLFQLLEQKKSDPEDLNSDFNE